MSQEALKLALKAIESEGWCDTEPVITAIQAALAQPAQHDLIGEVEKLRQNYENAISAAANLEKILAALPAQQAQQEPVAWLSEVANELDDKTITSFGQVATGIRDLKERLTTSPQPKEPEQKIKQPYRCDDPECVVCCPAQPEQQELDDSLLLCASDLGHSAIYDNHVEMQSCIRSVASRIKALTAPPQRTWVGLTDDELRKLCDEFWLYPRNLLKAIESKLKEKNT